MRFRFPVQCRDDSPVSETVEREIHHRVNWRELFATPGFRWLFLAMFISLFGTGLNFNGVTWWVLQETGSTVAVSLMSILDAAGASGAALRWRAD